MEFSGICLGPTGVSYESETYTPYLLSYLVVSSFPMACLFTWAGKTVVLFSSWSSQWFAHGRPNQEAIRLYACAYKSVVKINSFSS